MKSQHAGSLFGMLVVASSFALSNLAGLEIPYLKGQPAYAITNETLEQPVSESASKSAPQSVQMARRIPSVSR